MKKKTVITTEKHEIWVIRRPAGETVPENDCGAIDLIDSLTRPAEEMAELEPELGLDEQK